MKKTGAPSGLGLQLINAQPSGQGLPSLPAESQVSQEQLSPVQPSGNLSKLDEEEDVVTGRMCKSGFRAPGFGNVPFDALGKLPDSAVMTMDNLVNSMPQPKKKKAKKKKKAEDDDPDRPASPDPAAAPADGEEKKSEEKKKKRKKSPKKVEIIPEEPIPDISVNEAVGGTQSWNQVKTIREKSAVGVLTTATYDQRVNNFDAINKKTEELSTLLPQSNYIG